MSEIGPGREGPRGGVNKGTGGREGFRLPSEWKEGCRRNTSWIVTLACEDDEGYTLISCWMLAQQDGCEVGKREERMRDWGGGEIRVNVWWVFSVNQRKKIPIRTGGNNNLSRALSCPANPPEFTLTTRAHIVPSRYITILLSCQRPLNTSRVRNIPNRDWAFAGGGAAANSGWPTTRREIT
jgi:hypothetical protein